MKIYALARKINKKIKQRRREYAGRYLSPVRRFERFSVPEGEKLVSMTFDDGPMQMPINPVTKAKYQDWGLTKVLIDIMGEYGARGSFNVIGTTEHNYRIKERFINQLGAE